MKRLLTDMAGYALLLAAILTGWLPGPGGIPLALAGLALLSVHNAWARRVRQSLIARGSSWAHILFPDHPVWQIAYDILVTFLLLAAAVLAWQHGAIWQVSLGTVLFCAAIVIGLANRHRYGSILARAKRKH